MHRDGDGDGHDETAAPQYSPYSYADDDDREGGRGEESASMEGTMEAVSE